MKIRSSTAPPDGPGVPALPANQNNFKIYDDTIDDGNHLLGNRGYQREAACLPIPTVKEKGARRLICGGDVALTVT